MRLATLALLLAGCAAAPRTPFDQALDVVWRQTYGATCAPPAVSFDRGATCSDDAGSYDLAIEYAGQCYAGLYWPDRDRAEVVWEGSYSASSFAHELLHAWQWCRGVLDYDHAGPEWKTLLPAAVENLELLGL